ncbi:MAG: hypothetical protein IJE60_03955 [Tyzzerella sp.]|nr:hypothetical protein [Tyzzerella sp.]
MHRPTEVERNSCIRIVKDILKIENESECEQYANEIFKTTYFIGGDYSDKTLRAVAEALFNKL